MQTRSPSVYYEYIGHTGMLVHGQVTGRRYRFKENGAVAAVDSRDAPSFETIPQLRSIV